MPADQDATDRPIVDGGARFDVVVARVGPTWVWWPIAAERGEEVSLAALLDRLGAPASEAASTPPVDLPEGAWSGVVLDGEVLVQLPGGPRRLGRAELEAIDALPGALEEPPVLPPELLPALDRSPLRDPALGASLLAEGWVRVPLLDEEQVAALRDAYGEVHGWDGKGFEPDPGNPDVDYRRRVAEAIDGVIAAPFDTAFDRMVPVLRSFYCKWPGTPEIDLHCDWSCVDEHAGHRCYQVWIALQDTTTVNGHLLVVPRSHRVDPRPRGTGLGIPLSPELEAQDAAMRASLVPLDLKAGEALVFDLGLVHISSPNTTDEPRLAAAIVVRPEEASLVYFRRLGDGSALRYDVDDVWYNTMVPAELMTQLPELVPDAVVAVRPDEPVAARVQAILASPGA